MQHVKRRPGTATPSDATTVRPWVGKLAHWMDSKFRVPGTDHRFGFDPIIGLIPGIGDTVTWIIGAAMLGEAKRLGLGLGVMGKMIWNLTLDWFVGLIPGIDIVLDTAVKAHSKNAELLARAVEERDAPRTTQPHSDGSSEPTFATA